MSPVRPSARVRTRSQASREKLKEEREQILLWKQPLTTVNYSTRELLITLFEWGKRYVHNTNIPFDDRIYFIFAGGFDCCTYDR